MLYDQILQGDCVVFLGAGCTTEGRSLGRGTFYEEIKSKAKYPAGLPRPSFPQLMQYYCERVEGGHHNRLIREALSRIQMFCVPGEDNRVATMFTDALAEIPYLKRFVTTNWDPFLERSIGTLVPMVEDRDLAFWDDKKKQVIKIHGCITRPHSIVATQADYDSCASNNTLIFNKVRDLMTTKTFLFVGYSMRDADFREVWNGVTDRLGRFGRLAFAIDMETPPEAVSYWEGRGVQLVKTSDVLFVRELRRRLEKEGLVPPEKLLRLLQRQLRRITSIHMRTSQSTAGGFASAMYQDGVLHGLEEALVSAALGTKVRADLERDASEARNMVDRMKAARNPVEVAYWTGRQRAAEAFVGGDTRAIPPFFHPERLFPTRRLVKGERL